MKQKIVVLDGAAGNPGDISWEPLARLGDLTVFDRTSQGNEMIERARGAQIVLTNKVPFSRETIERLPELRYIGVIATGFNIVDIEAATEHGIVVTNVPAYSTASVAQIAIAHLLDITTGTAHYAEQTRQGVWSRCSDYTYWDRPFIELADKTMGIVGMGNIGTAVATTAHALGMKILAFSSKDPEQLPPFVTKAESLDDLFSHADVVSLHCPLTPETRRLVDKRRLALMKPTAILINTSRGALIDEDALAAALKEGRLAAAALDVLNDEPPKADNPVTSLPNCHITPHLGWTSNEARRRLHKVLADNIESYLAGKPINVVN